MGHPLVDSLAKEFIAEVRDQTLTARKLDFLGTFAVAQNNAVYKGLVEGLDDSQKDLLWKLVADTVEQTMGAALAFLDHKHATHQMRVVLYDPDTAEPVVPLELTGEHYLDLTNEFWFNWLENYPQVKDRPRTQRRPASRDDLPPALLTAVAEDFPGEQVLSQEQEVLTPEGEVVVYHLLLSGRDAPIAFRPDGGRARVV